MLRGESWSGRALMLALLMSGLSGCSVKSIDSAEAVAPPATPSLPSEARQPKASSMCSPTCSSKWSEQAGKWRQRLIDVE